MDPVRNKTEARFAEILTAASLPWEYEVSRLPYTLHRRYIPDFTSGNLFLEVKGYWPQSDRAKIKAVRLGNPDALIVMVFQRPDSPISKTSKTTYAQWCDRWGIAWIPFPENADDLRQCLKDLFGPTSPAPGAAVQTQLLSDKTTA
jgi:hypothetical protein